MTLAIEVQPMTQERAREVTDRIKSAASAVRDMLIDAYHGRADKALGYSSYIEYFEMEFGGSCICLPVEDLPALEAARLPQRVMAVVTKTPQSTVSDMLRRSSTDRYRSVDSVGLDGRTRSYEGRSIPPLATVSECGIDNSYADGLRQAGDWLAALTRNPTPTQADALHKLLTATLAKLERSASCASK